MIEEHERLLGFIQKAEAEGLKLLAKGPRIDDCISSLRAAARPIKERIAHYKREARAGQANAEGSQKETKETKNFGSDKGGSE
jgi:hypothetical protein